MSQSPCGCSLISRRYGPKPDDGAVKLTPKLSQPELDGPPQSEDVDAGMNCPVQVTRVLASDTEPEAGFAPRVIGLTITAMHAANRHNDAASAYLALVVAETFRVFRSFLSMSSSPSVLINQQAFRTISARLMKRVAVGVTLPAAERQRPCPKTCPLLTPTMARSRSEARCRWRSPWSQKKTGDRFLPNFLKPASSPD